MDAERAPAVKAWEQSLYEKGFWRAPEAIPEALDAKINSDAPATEQLDELEGWLDRQKDHAAGDWPAGEFTGGIPAGWASLTNLKKLSMQYCGLDGGWLNQNTRARN